MSVTHNETVHRRAGAYAIRDYSRVCAIASVCYLLCGCHSDDEIGDTIAVDTGGMGQQGAAGVSGVSGNGGTTPFGGSGAVNGDAGSSGEGIAGSGGGAGEVAMDGSVADGATTGGAGAIDSGNADTGGTGSGGTGGIGPNRLPPINTSFDYQLGGAYPPPDGVGVVSRDRNASPATGIYNICYINGFQTQPGEEALWENDLILRDGDGAPIIDPNWGEMLLDVSTADKRSRISVIVGGWIEGCATDGYDAVEIDNLDTYSRSGGRITQDNAVAFIALLADIAQDSGLAIAQKNSAEILDRRAEMGTDFAVVEECNRWNECGDFVSVYGDHVLMIEYSDDDFAAGCAAYGATHAIVHRDLLLVMPGNPAYVYEGC